LDKENSEIITNRSGKRIFSIESLVLNEEILRWIELENRKIFLLAEKTSVLLVHVTLKQAMLSFNPVGCRFIDAEEWNCNISFS
jgi:hypothetical protein